MTAIAVVFAITFVVVIVVKRVSNSRKAEENIMLERLVRASKGE